VNEPSLDGDGDGDDVERPHPLPPDTAAFVVDGVMVTESGVRPLQPPSLDGPIMLADREGVFAHSFKCLECRLEWALFSWRRDRHRVGEVFCPECGRQTPMLHYRATLSSSRAMVLDDTRLGDSLEIFHCVPVGDADLMSDSPFPE
jgi:hypothetical protein